MKILVDYETFYSKEISVADMGVRNYVAATEAYILSIVSEDGMEFVGTIEQCREHFGDSFWTDPSTQFGAANANFDYAWNGKYFAPTVKPWKCILDLGVYHQLPRHLAGLTARVLGVKMDKKIRADMKGVRYEDLPDDQQQRVNDYCLDDSRYAMAVWKKLPPMSPIEDKIAEHTRMINRRGVHIDQERLEKDKQNVSVLRHKAFLEIPWHENEAPLSPEAFAEWCQMKRLPCPPSVDKRDASCTALMAQHPELDKVIRSMRRYRSANSILKKAEEVEARACDGLMPMEILYCGAPHTRRFSSKGVNMQNLMKEPTIVDGPWDAPQVMEAIKDGTPIPSDVIYIWQRNWFVPPPNHTFLIFDYAQVEPRVLNWLAGNEEMMEGLRNGFSYYEAYARAAKGWKGAAGTLKKEFGVERYTKLKNECLGCGYGMGAKKYCTYVNPPIPEADAKIIVDGFRKTNPRIVKFWRRLDDLIVTAARSRDRQLQIEMPSGDLLIHWDVQAHGKGHKSTTVKGEYTHQTIQNRLWGGTLTENVVQRCSRDLLADALIRLEDAGMPVVFHCHDEVILSVPDDGSKDEAKKEAERILSTTPDWAEGLPLAVEGDFAACYLK